MAAVETVHVYDVMTDDVIFVNEDELLMTAAQLLGECDVGALPICDDNGNLQGILTDRDIVVRCVAMGKDPTITPVAEIESDGVVTVEPSDRVVRAAELMTEHRVRRLPVCSDGKLVGMISQADIARNLPPTPVGELVTAISAIE